MLYWAIVLPALRLEMNRIGPLAEGGNQKIPRHAGRRMYPSDWILIIADIYSR